MFNFGLGIISWCGKRQPIVSLSTSKAKYRVAATTTQESIWPIQLIKDLHQPMQYCYIVIINMQFG